MTIEKRQLAFGETLRRLREQAGHATGKEFATRLGWLPSKVSRIETGKSLPADSDVIDWLDAVSATDEVAERARDQLRDLRLAKSSWRHLLRAGHEPVQRRFAKRERNAGHIVNVEFYIVPGLVQTAEYARAVFEIAAAEIGSPPDTESAVTARIRRQDILYDPNKRIDLLVAEAALRYPVCSRPVLIGQIDRLTTLIGLPNVRIGVIPLDTRLPVISMHGYSVTDDVITVEVNHTDIEVTDPEDIALYNRITDRLWSVAVEADDARALLTRIAAELGER